MLLWQLYCFMGLRAVNDDDDDDDDDDYIVPIS